MNLFLNASAILIVMFVLLMMVTAIVNLLMRVPYVPSRMRVVKKMIEVAKIQKKDVVYDLGCGDARLLIEAEKKSPKATKGYEMAPIPYLLGYLKKWRNRSKVKLSMSNFFNTSLKDADVIFCYLGTETMTKLGKKLKKECRKGTRIISNTFHIEGMKPAKVWKQNRELKLPSIYLYEI